MNIKHFLLAAALFATAACSKDEPGTVAVPQKADYAGTLTVTYQGTEYASPGITVKLEPSEDGKQATMTLCKVKFVPQMPVTLDVTVPGIVLNTSSSGTTLTCEKVVPLAMGGEVERYTVTGLKGNLKDDKLSFSLNFGNFPTRFEGTKER